MPAVAMKLWTYKHHLPHARTFNLERIGLYLGLLILAGEFRVCMPGDTVSPACIRVLYPFLLWVPLMYTVEGGGGFEE